MNEVTYQIHNSNKSVLRNIKKSPKKKASSNLRVTGPIRVMVVEPTGRYCKTVWLSIGIGVSHLMIGATNMMILYYSIIKGDSHATLCSVSYQLCSAEAILALNHVNGWSAPLRLRHRKVAHMLLQVCAIIFAIIGTSIVTIDRGPVVNFHGLIGLILIALALLNMFIGLAAMWNKRRIFKNIHRCIGVPTFFMSSLSAISGLIYPAFREWAGVVVMCLLIGFIVFFTIFIFTGSFIKCMQKIKI